MVSADRTGSGLRRATGANSKTMGPSEELILDEACFHRLAELFREEVGMLIAPEMRASVERRLKERVLSLGLTSFSDYCRLLRSPEKNRAEIDEAIDLVTVNETYFFRAPQQLLALQTELFPVLAAEPGRHTIRMWSAGCSTGEEAYSLAIASLDSDLPSNIEVRVLGTDVSRRCINFARRGVYGRSAFRATPRETVLRHFIPEGDEHRVSESLRDRTSFAHMNLLDGARASMIGRMDVIFCRNVFIYLDEPARHRAVDVFYERLAPGGFLLLGHSESLLHMTTRFEHCHLRDELVYRKPLSIGRSAPRR